MDRLEDGSITMDAVDSNFPSSTLTWIYRAGSETIDTGSASYGSTLAYAGFERDLKKIDETRRSYCR